MISVRHDDEQGMIVSSSQDAIRRVVEAFERSDWSEIDVRFGDVRVRLATAAGGHSDRVRVAADTAGGASPDDPRPQPRVAEPAAASIPDGAHVVAAPSPGIYWRSPEPGAPPFADVGQVVEASATVCIVEVMKLMNHVKAGVGGEVVAVYGTDGVAVHKGQVLFAIDPAGSSA